MTTRRVPDWLDGFLAYTSESEPPEKFRLWVGISTVASMLKRKCQISWGPINFFPNLYIVLVSPPGQARKGTAMSFGIDFQIRAGIKMCADSITKEALVRKISEAMSTDILEDASMRFHSSYTIVSPELTSLLGNGDPQMISWLTDWFDCGKGSDGIWEYVTKHQGEDRIAGIWVNLLGATTPDLIGKIPDIIGSGLSSRIIFIFEHRQEKICPEPFLSKELKQLKEDLYHDLEQIQLLQGEFKVTPEFVNVWKDWYTKQSLNPPFQDKRLARYCTRRGTHVMKLSMVCSASRSDDMIITDKDLLRAISFLEAAEVKMPYVFGSMGESPMAKTLNNIMGDIGRSGRITQAELLRRHYYDIGNSRIFDDMITILEKQGFCKRYQMKGEVIIEHLPGGK
jgi:hypothetical protein